MDPGWEGPPWRNRGRRCQGRGRFVGGSGIPAPRIEVQIEDRTKGPRDDRVLDDHGPPAIPRAPVGGKSRLSEVLGSDPRGGIVHDGVFRMEVPIPLHEILPAREEPDPGAGGLEGADQLPFLRLDPADGRSLQQDSDRDPSPCGIREDGRDPLARERVHADLDRRGRGGEEGQERPLSEVRRHDRRRGAIRSDALDVEFRLSQAIGALTIPVRRVAHVDEESRRISRPNRELATASSPSRRAFPARPGIQGISVCEGIDNLALSVHQEDLVPCVREAEDPALHPSRVPALPREVRRREDVLCIARRVPRHDDPAAGGHDDVERERDVPFAVGEGPPAQVDRSRVDVLQFDEFVIPGGTRVHARD